MRKNVPPAVFFEMLQSFVTLAKNLNLSKTVSELGISRQTIRRHITKLEQLRNEELIVLRDRKYTLTLVGQQAFLEANILLGKATDWIASNNSYTGGLRGVVNTQEEGVHFYAQRHATMNIWAMAPPLLQKGLQAWSAAESLIENAKLKIIRPYLMIYRKNGADWVCAEVGEKSSYATWLGWTWAKSTVGTNFYNDHISSQTDRFIIEAYETVARTGGVWYDHISTEFQRSEYGEPVPVNYQRLIFACKFPNGKPAVASLVARTNNIQIDGVDPVNVPLMPKQDLMEFEV